MGKVENIVEKVIENEQEIKELLSKQSIEDLYEFFLAKDRSLTVEEFDDEVYDILEYYSKNVSASLKELEEIEIEQIAGGKNDFIKKSLSASLCALMLNSGINVSASSNSVNQHSQKVVSVSNNKKQENSITLGKKIKTWIKKNKKALIITSSVTGAIVVGIIVSVVVYKHKKNANNSKNTVSAPIGQEVKQQSEQHSKQQSKKLSKDQPEGGTGDKSSKMVNRQTRLVVEKQTQKPKNSNLHVKKTVQDFENQQKVDATKTSEKHTGKKLTVAELRKIYSSDSKAVFPNVPSESKSMLERAALKSAEYNFYSDYGKFMQDFQHYSEGFKKTMRTLSEIQNMGGNTRGFLERVEVQLRGLNDALGNMKKLEVQSQKPYLSRLDDSIRPQLTSGIADIEEEVFKANSTLNEMFKDEIQKMDNWASMILELQTNANYILQGLKNGANT